MLETAPSDDAPFGYDGFKPTSNPEEATWLDIEAIEPAIGLCR